MNLADILKDIGNEGYFQVVAILILAMPKMPIQWSMTIMSYVAYEPDWCCVPEGGPDDICGVEKMNISSSSQSTRSTHKKCSLNSSSCSRRIFLDPDGASTSVTEWDLVCEHKWVVSSLSSIQMAGVMVGAVLCGFLADEFGRKHVHFCTLLVHALLNVGAGLSTSWPMFAVFRFGIGAAIGAYLVVHVPYILEFVSPRWRVIPASLPFAAIGASLLPLAAWMLPDWRWMHFLCALMCAPFLVGYFYMPESVRWLTVKGRVEEAAKVVDHIARMNKREYNPEKCLQKIKKVAERERETLESGQKYTYVDVYRGWRMARLTLTQQFVWFTTSLVGYGIIFGVSGLAGNVYLNMFLVEAIEIPFVMATYYFNNCIGRRYTALVYFSMAALTASLALVFHLVPTMANRDMSITTMCISCRVFVAGAAAVFIVVSTEVYPTVIRTLGFGAANTAAKVGGVLAPFVINMDAAPTVAFSAMFVTCLLCVVAVLSLAETKNLVMEDTLDSGGGASSTQGRPGSIAREKGALKRSKSQPRIIIDFDIDLIHHRSYSEFEDDNDDDNSEEMKLVRRRRKGRERFPLMRRGQQVYDACSPSPGHSGEDYHHAGGCRIDNSVVVIPESSEASETDSTAFDSQADSTAFDSQADCTAIDSQSDSTVKLHSVVGLGQRLSQPQGLDSQPQEVVGQPQGVVSQPQGVVSQPQEVVSQPQGVVSQPQEALSQPRGVSKPEGVSTPQGDSQPQGVNQLKSTLTNSQNATEVGANKDISSVTSQVAEASSDTQVIGEGTDER